MRPKTALGLTLLCGVMLFAGACTDGHVAGPTASAQSELAVTQQFNDLEGVVFWNGCAGEYVGFASGSIQHVVADSRSDGSGGYHVRFHRNGQHYNGPGLAWTGSSLEPTGTEYVGTSLLNYSMNAKPPYPREYTLTERVRLIQKGPGPDSFLNIVDHITVNAAGDVTADVIDVFITCK